jgi:hypothetical protein
MRIPSFMKWAQAQIIVLFISTVTVAQPIGWVATGYDGSAVINKQITQVEIDPAGRVMGVVATGPQLLITSDKGISWQSKDIGHSDVVGLEFFKGSFYLATKSELYRSASLENWQAVTLPFSVDELIDLKGDRGFLEVTTKSGKYAFSVDGIEYQTLSFNDPISESGIALKGDELHYIGASGYYKRKVSASAWDRISDGTTVKSIAIVRDSIFVGKNIGVSPKVYRSLLGAPLTVAQVNEIFVQGALRVDLLYTIRDTVLGVFREHELHHAFNRFDLSPPLSKPGFTLNDFSMDDKGNYVLSNSSGIFVSTDFSNNWQKYSKRLEVNTATELLAYSNDILFAATNQGMIMRSNDAGASWSTIQDLRDTITLLAKTNAGTLIVGQPGILLASTDQGETFLGTAGFEARTPYAMIQSKAGKILLGTDSGMYYSTDDGATWFIPRGKNMNINTGTKRLPPVYALALDSANRLYIGTNQGVLYSPNEGDSIDRGWLRNNEIIALQAAPDGRIYAGSHWTRSDDTIRENWYTYYPGGSWLTPDENINPFEMNVMNINSKVQLVAGPLFTWRGGIQWEISPVPDPVENIRVTAQDIAPNDVVYIAYYDKIYRSASPKVSSVKTVEEQKALQIFPNPAAHQVVIGELQGHLRIVNSLGVEVWSAEVSAGQVIDVFDLSSGSYHVLLTSEGARYTSPLIIAR